MPLYEYECPVCQLHQEMMLPLSRWDEKVRCPVCGEVMDKMIFPILTCLPHNKRKWGTSLYRSHKRGEKVSKPKQPTFAPMMKRKEK